MLCTPDKTFELRQVQTSNLLFVTKPALEAHGNEIPIPVTRAIASCTQTLELHPYAPSAATLLQEVLPVYELVDGEVDAISNKQNKTAIFNNLPLSDGQCQAGWDEIVAFEHEESSYRPSANALLKVWSSINAAALAEGVKLDKQFLTNDITRAVSEEGHASNLVDALLSRLSEDGQDVNGPWSCLDRVKTVAFVGKSLLGAKRSNDYLIAEFTDTWENELPEAWRKDAQLSAIEGAYNFPTDTTIGTKKSTTISKTSGSTTTTKSSTGKWHEKFGKTRKK